jgi:hypothetical protein
MQKEQSFHQLIQKIQVFIDLNEFVKPSQTKDSRGNYISRDTIAGVSGDNTNTDFIKKRKESGGFLGLGAKNQYDVKKLEKEDGEDRAVVKGKLGIGIGQGKSLSTGLSRLMPSLFGNSDKRRQQQGAIDTFHRDADKSDDAIKAADIEDNKYIARTDAIRNAANAARDKTQNDARPEAIRLLAAKTAFRNDPTPANQAAFNAAEHAEELAGKKISKIIKTKERETALTNRDGVDDQISTKKSGILGNTWKAYIASAKYRMQQSPGIGSFMNAPGKKEDLPDNQKDNDRNRQMTPQDCLQLKRDTIPGRWLALRGRYGCTNP